jgi:hypothetical protein
MKNEPNKITATLKVIISGEFYDDEASEEMLRYCVEQDLEDAGFDVDVELLKEREPMPVIITWQNKDCKDGNCPSCEREISDIFHPKCCGYCGQELKWE